jgi:SAM-dependent methyltransferase
MASSRRRSPGPGCVLMAERAWSRTAAAPVANARPGQDTEVFDEAYFVGASKSNYVDYGDVERAIDKGFMPEVLRYAAVAGAGKDERSYLDIGCAFGFYVRRLSSLGWEAAGVDVSEYAIGQGRARGIANLHIASAQDLPFPDESFDFVTAIDVIEHVPPEEGPRVVEETRRVLRKGGLAMYATPNFLSNRYWNVRHPQFVDPDRTHINYQSVESLRALFAEFTQCDIFGHTPFPDQLRVFDAFGHPFLQAPPVRRLARRVAWRVLGESIDHSSYLHAVAVK